MGPCPALLSSELNLLLEDPVRWRLIPSQQSNVRSTYQSGAFRAQFSSFKFDEVCDVAQALIHHVRHQKTKQRKPKARQPAPRRPRENVSRSAEERLQCQYCLDKEVSYSTHCGYVGCLECLQKWGENQCPVCRKRTKIHRLYI